MTAAAIKTNSLSDRFLLYYPRYQLALAGFETLRKLNQPTLDAGKEIQVGVLSITDASWPILVQFLQSETATRKSGRGDPSFNQWVPPSPPAPTSTSSPSSSTAVAPKSGVAPATSPPLAPSPPQGPINIPGVDYARIKTIVCVKLDVLMAGNKPLVPPYHLVVFWPVPIARHVYEFLSFDEFLADLKKVMLDEIEAASLWLSVVALAITIATGLLRTLIRRRTRALPAAQAATEPAAPA